MMRLFSMTLAEWNVAFQFTSAILLGLTFAVGAGAIITGYVLNKRQTVLIAETGRDAALAKESTARLSLRIEEESKERVKAELELERLKKQVGPRRLDREAFLKALAGQPKAPVQILYLRDDADSLEFAQEIENQLRRAGWTVTTREPIPVAPGSGPDIPITMSVGGQPSGVTVVARSITEEEADAGRKRIIDRDDWVRTPWTVLVDAFGNRWTRHNRGAILRRAQKEYYVWRSVRDGKQRRARGWRLPSRGRPPEPANFGHYRRQPAA